MLPEYFFAYQAFTDRVGIKINVFLTYLHGTFVTDYAILKTDNKPQSMTVKQTFSQKMSSAYRKRSTRKHT